MQLHDFYNFANELYLQKKVPKEQAALSNFSDITDRNTQNLITLFESLKNDSKEHSLLNTLYHKKLNFPKLTFDQQEDVCEKITNICKDVERVELLIDKICMLNEFGITLFLSHGISENPSDTLKKPYIINISKFNLSFDKDYYFDSKYERELKGLRKHNRELFKLLCKRHPQYFKYTDNQIEQICDDFDYVESLIAPFVLSNVCKRDVEARVNIYKLKEIDSAFRNINLLDSCFLTNDFDLTNDTKPLVDVVFSSNINNCRRLDKQFIESTLEEQRAKYKEYELDHKKKYDNGEYYWYFMDDLFRKYRENDPIKGKIDNYIIWKIINSFTGLISEELRLEKFKFHGTFLNGQITEKTEKERSIQYLIEMVPELVGKLFCDTYFLEDHYNLMKKLVGYLLDTYDHNFKNKCDWLMNDKKSLNEALQKLDILKLEDHQKIGYPREETYNYKYKLLFDILNSKNLGLGDLSLFDYEIIFNKWVRLLDAIKYKRDTPDYTSWEMCAAETNAYYHPLKNEMVFPAGILQEPFFVFLSNEQLNGSGIDLYNNPIGELLADRSRISKLDKKYETLRYITMASNFGSIGKIIGHEISHGFDDQGSKFDAYGKIKMWWSDTVKQAYEKITDKIIKQFNAYNLELKIGDNINLYHVNGKLTLGENIADLFGLSITIDAFKKYYNDNKKSFIKTLDECMMELLISFANTWRYVELPERTKGRINGDVHSPPIFRVIGTLYNTEEYCKIFGGDIKADIIKIFH